MVPTLRKALFIIGAIAPMVTEGIIFDGPIIKKIG
jgi:hypothetical protein